MPVSQKFARQGFEDGANPESRWGKDLPVPATSETEDPDDEDNMPIPVAEPPVSGKTPARNPIQDWTDDDSDDCQVIDDDDCQVIEALDIRPIAFAYPLPSTSADPTNPDAPVAAGKRGGSRKRAETDTSGTGTSTADAPKPKRQKRPGNKLEKPASNSTTARGGKKLPPTTEG